MHKSEFVCPVCGGDLYYTNLEMRLWCKSCWEFHDELKKKEVKV